MAKSIEADNKKDKSNTPCLRKSYYDKDVGSYGVCKTIVLPALVKAALATTATTKKISMSNEQKGVEEEELDDSLLYAVVAGVFYAFVMVFLILANLHPSKSLLADLERYESLVEAREQKFNDKMFAKFVLTTASNQKEFQPTNNDKRHPSSHGSRADTAKDNRNNSCPECQTYHQYHNKLKNSSKQQNHFQL